MTKLRAMAAFIQSLHRRQEGQGLAEYSLALALIAILAISALLFLGSNVSNTLSGVGEALNAGSQEYAENGCPLNLPQNTICVRVDPPSDPGDGPV